MPSSYGDIVRDVRQGAMKMASTKLGRELNERERSTIDRMDSLLQFQALEVTIADKSPDELASEFVSLSGDRPDPNNWKLSSDRTADAMANLERLRKFALRVTELAPDLTVDLADDGSGADAYVEIHIRKVNLVLATIGADAPGDDYFLCYPFGDEDAGCISDADQAVRECAGREAESAASAMRARKKKWWQVWKRRP